MRDKKKQRMPSDRWKSAILLILNEHGKQADIVRTIGTYDSELGQMTANRIDDLSALPDKHFPDAVNDQHLLLLLMFYRDKAHRRPCHRFADCLGVGSVILVRFDVGSHKLSGQ